MPALVVLQSRLTSSRLPAKALLSVAGRPVVVLAAQRAANRGHDVVVATSDRSDDDLIATAVAGAGIAVVRGSLDDPLDRFVTAAARLGPADVVVRLTADNLLPDGALVDRLLAAVAAGHPYARVGGSDPAVPYGVSAEAFAVSALRAAGSAAVEAFDREHVTPWIRRTYGDHVVPLDGLDPDWRGLRATIDTLDDYVRMAGLFATVKDPVAAPWQDLAHRLARLEPGERAQMRPGGGANPLGQSRLILGTVQLGVAYGAANDAGMPSSEVAREILRVAARRGVTHVDTARAYGSSERRIGDALARGLGEHLRVVTKVRPLDDVPADAPAGWGEAAASLSFAESLRSLRAGSVDALLTHRAGDWEKPGVRTALLAARERGEARAVGVSLATPEELGRLLADPALDYVQLPFNLLDDRWLQPAAQEALARRADVTVTVRSVFLQGLLSAPDPRWPESPHVDRDAVLAAVDGLVADLGRSSRADLALAYVLGHPWVTSVVVGAELPQQVAETTALVAAPPLGDDEIAEVRRRLPAVSPDLLDPSRWKMSR